ncbi:MAG: hypothetical protein GC182_16985 [Rhodopseudomonas sp.]|nr:hypothetical protein [Rhodopseudomonas sp.]
MRLHAGGVASDGDWTYLGQEPEEFAVSTTVPAPLPSTVAVEPMVASRSHAGPASLSAAAAGPDRTGAPQAPDGGRTGSTWPLLLLALLGGALLAVTIGLWVHFGSTVFFEVVRTGWSACF